MHTRQMLLAKKLFCKNSGGSDENAPGWHIFPFVSEDNTIYSAHIDGAAIPMRKLSSHIPKAVFDQKWLSIMELNMDGTMSNILGGVTSLNFVESDGTFGTNEDMGLLMCMYDDVGAVLLEFTDKETAAEVGVPPGTYVLASILSPYVVMVYYVEE